MKKDRSVSAGACFLFLLNIIVGTGVFLNTGQLYFLLNKYSYLAYILTGFLMIPIIWITYLLAYENPGFNLTGLFDKYFGSWNKVLVPLYSLSKLATTVIGMLFVSSLLRNMLFHSIKGAFVNILCFLFIYLLSVFLVYYDVSINYIVQKIIIFIKLIPLLGIILFFLYYFFSDSLFYSLIFNQKCNIIDNMKLLQGASITIFAFSGFESLFAINHLLGGNKRRGAFLLGLSFFCAWILYILYQFCIGNLSLYFLVDNLSLLPFVVFMEKCFGQVMYSWLFILFINIAIMFSSLGVAHGIMYATVNNLFSSLNFIFIDIKYSKYFVFCLVPLYAFLGRSNIFILQQLASLGTIITYGLFVYSYYKMKDKKLLLYFFGLFSILIFLLVHFYNAFCYFGFVGYFVYGFLILLLLFLKFVYYRKLMV